MIAAALPRVRVLCGEVGADSGDVGEADPAQVDAAEVDGHEQDHQQDRDENGELNQALATRSSGGAGQEPLRLAEDLL